MKSDRQLSEHIKEELCCKLGVHAACIALQAHNGTVTLAGQVDTHAHRQRAACAAQCVSGVKSLVVQIDVKRIGAKTTCAKSMPPWASF